MLQLPPTRVAAAPSSPGRPEDVICRLAGTFDRKAASIGGQRSHVTELLASEQLRSLSSGSASHAARVLSGGGETTLRPIRHAFADAADRLRRRGFIALAGGATASATLAGTTRARAQGPAGHRLSRLGIAGALRQPPRSLPRRPGRRGLRRRAHGRRRVPVGRRPVQQAAGAGQGAGKPSARRHRGARRRRGRAGGKIGDGEDSRSCSRWAAIPSRSASSRACRGPAANITGVSSLSVEVSRKRLEFMREVRPAANRFAVADQSAKPDLGVATEEPAGRGGRPRASS